VRAFSSSSYSFVRIATFSLSGASRRQAGRCGPASFSLVLLLYAFGFHRQAFPRTTSWDRILAGRWQWHRDSLQSLVQARQSKGASTRRAIRLQKRQDSARDVRWWQGGTPRQPDNSGDNHRDLCDHHPVTQCVVCYHLLFSERCPWPGVERASRRGHRVGTTPWFGQCDSSFAILFSGDIVNASDTVLGNLPARP